MGLCCLPFWGAEDSGGKWGTFSIQAFPFGFMLFFSFTQDPKLGLFFIQKADKFFLKLSYFSSSILLLGRVGGTPKVVTFKKSELPSWKTIFWELLIEWSEFLLQPVFMIYFAFRRSHLEMGFFPSFFARRSLQSFFIMFQFQHSSVQPKSHFPYLNVQFSGKVGNYNY